MGFFTRRVPGLQTVFPSSNLTIAQPNVVTEEVQLTYDFPPRVAPLQSLTRQNFVSNNAATPVFAAYGDVPEGFYDEIIELSISHTSGTIQLFKLVLVDPSGGGCVVGNLTVANGAIAGESLYCNDGGATAGRTLPIFIPPGWELQMFGNTGAAYTFTASAIIVRHPLAEVPVR